MDFVLYKTMEECCAILGFTAQSRTLTSANTLVTDCEDVDKLGKSPEDLSIRKGKAVS